MALFGFTRHEQDRQDFRVRAPGAQAGFERIQAALPQEVVAYLRSSLETRGLSLAEITAADVVKLWEVQRRRAQSHG